MKTLRIIPFVAIGILLVAIVSRQSVAQTSSLADDRGALGQYERLVLSLLKRGDTNTANQVASLVTAAQEGRDATDIATTVRILQSLRSGDTNAAIKFLESRLDGALIPFCVPSTGPRDTNYDKILAMARDYRAKYPHTSGVPDIDNGVSRTFSLLPK
jgi:hypothetical protein